MIICKNGNKLQIRSAEEWIEIEAWETNALRVRATRNTGFSDENKGISYVAPMDVECVAEAKRGSIRNGRICCEVTGDGVLGFYRDGQMILKEYVRCKKGRNYYGVCLDIAARQYRPRGGNEYSLSVLFEANRGEKIFGMGQYQQPELDLKGCVLELAQRNSQISVPFYVSNLGYGFLWNHPGVGQVMFGNNYTEWTAEAIEEMDYWIVADENPQKILESFTEVTGRSPAFPDNALGLWQCKLRYSTQAEVLEVAREYKRRGIKPDVIVIDFFHWTEQGDWKFDSECFPDPKSMMDELHSMGIRCMVSIWPTVSTKSENYAEMKARDLLVRCERGLGYTFDWMGPCAFYDATNPEARAFLWSKAKENYYKYGIDMFWLDEAEPEFQPYEYDHYRYHAGRTAKTAGYYPSNHAQCFWEGQRAEGQNDIVNLSRCAWVGSQKYGAVVWSGDVESSFRAFRDQLSAGLNMGLAGHAWWTTDIGGFRGAYTDDPEFRELLIRWYQFAVFTPVLRMHGNRLPKILIPGKLESGQPNELWSYGEENYAIMKKWLGIRLEIKDYVASLYREASENGSPLMRTMFYEFPEDSRCWEIDDQYMFGSKYLVAPVMEYEVRERQVYLPAGRWKSIHDETEYDGGQTITADAPIDIMPVFERMA
ncbi:MAG: glycoside hydrolase family 31 protein [Clostridia bacterium]|nr:glycoside hydrolase family 31 protein [Clostridia bacterium]